MNRSFAGPAGEVLGDDVGAAAMIDRLVHPTPKVITLKRDSYRLKDRDLGRVPSNRCRNPTVNHRSGKRLSQAADATPAAIRTSVMRGHTE
jgi:hypothetical protein